MLVLQSDASLFNLIINSAILLFEFVIFSLLLLAA